MPKAVNCPPGSSWYNPSSGVGSPFGTCYGDAAAGSRAAADAQAKLDGAGTGREKQNGSRGSGSTGGGNGAGAQGGGSQGTGEVGSTGNSPVSRVPGSGPVPPARLPTTTAPSDITLEPRPAEVKEERRTVVGQGKTEACYDRDYALKLAHIAADNDGHDECYALGPRWRFSKRTFQGYEQCARCGSSNEYRCAVTQAAYLCVQR